MRFKSKEEFAKAIIDAGEDGLILGTVRVNCSSTRRDMSPFQAKWGTDTSMDMYDTWNKYNQDWQPYVKPIPDKALVWCWDNDQKTQRILAVYEGVNNNLFSLDGSRNGVTYINYKQLTPEEIQPWMQELIDNCED